VLTSLGVGKTHRGVHRTRANHSNACLARSSRIRQTRKKKKKKGQLKFGTATVCHDKVHAERGTNGAMPPPGTTNTKNNLTLLNDGSAGEVEGNELDPELLDEDDEFEDETWFDKATAGTIFVVVVLAITSTLVSGIEIYAAMNLTGYTIPSLGEANMSTVRWRSFLFGFGVPSHSRPSSTFANAVFHMRMPYQMWKRESYRHRVQFLLRS
jgi:hypothetical protein